MDPRPGSSKGPFQGQHQRPLHFTTDTDSNQSTTQKGPFQSQRATSNVTAGAQYESPASPSPDVSMQHEATYYGSPLSQGTAKDSSAASSVPSPSFNPYERDVTALDRLLKAGGLSTGMAQWMRLLIMAREAAVEGRELNESNRATLSLAEKAGISLPLKIQAGRSTARAPRGGEVERERKRQRSRSLSLTPPADKRHQQGRTISPSPSRNAEEQRSVKRTCTPQQKISFADIAKKGGKANEEKATSGSSKPPAQMQPKQREGPRYPPLIVENLPNWTFHFKKIGNKLGRPPNGRPYGQGIRFSPEDEGEYRLIQAYLSELEKEEGISWFSYSLPAEQSLKVAIRGLPSSTPTEELHSAFEEKGFELEYAKNIKGRQGRPGSIFYALFKKTDNIAEIYKVSEVLFMPGITIEAWRGKKGPAQCHKCQKWRHSSHGCHRQQACVRCGEPHFARECPRPREEPATCANCKGAHPANFHACPTYRKETRNRKAGTVAQTEEFRGRRGTAPVEQNVVEETTTASLMAPARNPAAGPAHPSAPPTKKHRRKARKSSAAAAAAAATAAAAPATKPAQERQDSLGQTIEVLKEILEAVKSGVDAETAALRGIMRLVNKKDGH